MASNAMIDMTRVTTSYKKPHHHVITSLDEVNEERVAVLVGGIENCFFDLFDTIISRSVDPEYIKVIWAHRLIAEFGLSMRDQQLYELRLSLEGVICKANREAGFDDDLRYIHFARSLYLELKRAGNNLGGVSDFDFAERVLNIEIAVELEHQFVRPEGLKLLSTFHGLGRRCVAVSDTYLPYSAITTFLEKLGVRHYFERLFLSSEPLLTKRSGRLFRLVLDTMQVVPIECLMVGDNPYSDIERGTALGLNTLHLPVTHHGEKGRDKFWTSFQEFETRLNAIVSDTSLPFWEMLLPVALFCRDLHKHASSRGIRHLFFCSREGQPLKKFFEIYRSLFADPLPCDSHYLFVSRRATFLPGCGPLDTETFEPLFRQYREISVLEFLQSLGMDISEAEQISKGLASTEEKASDFPNSIQFQHLKAAQKFRSWYQRNSERQRQLLTAHLEKTGELGRYDSVSLVDVGWKGTIQDNLRRMLPPHVRLNGFYMGLLAEVGITPSNAKFASVFSSSGNLSRYYEMYSESCSLFEILLAADHGSVRRYGAGENGTLVPELDFQENENALYAQKLMPLLTSFYKLFPSIAELLNSYDGCEEELKKFVALKFVRPVLAPTEKEVGIVNGVQHYENFGLFCGTKFGRESEITGITRARHAVNFLISPRNFRSRTNWPAVEFHRQGISRLRGLYVRDKLAHWFGTPPSRALKLAWQLRRGVKVTKQFMGR